MSGAGARGTRLTVPQRDVLLVLVLLPLVAVAGVAIAWAVVQYGLITVLPIFLLVLALGVLAMTGLRIAFLLMVLTLAFPFRSQALFEGFDMHSTYVLIPLVAILAAVQLAYGKVRLPRGLLPPLLVMLLGGVIAGLAGPDPGGSLTRLFFGLGMPMLVGLVAAAVIKPERDIGALTNVLALALIGLGIICLAQMAGIAPPPFEPIFSDERVNGLFYHPNILGAYLAANLVLLAGIAAFRGKSGLYLLVPIGIGVAALVATLSRGPILGLVAGFLLVMVLLAKRRPASLLVLVVIVPLILAFALPEAPSSQRAALTERFNQALEPDAEPGRKAIWNAAEQQIAQHPLTGVGALTFAETFQGTASTANVDQDVTHAHNIFLEGYLSLGPLGMVGLIWLVAGAIGNYWRATTRDGPNGRKIAGFAIGAIGAIFSIVISSMVDFPFWQIEMTAFAFLLIGVGYAITRREPAIAAQLEAAEESAAANASRVRARKPSVASA